jgi:uncharacterized protein (DUF488 family)
MGSSLIPEDLSASAIHTIGHAAHPIEEFVALLRRHDIRVLADVRRAPGSRHAPQFNARSLAAALQAHSIAYVHIPELGGWRSAAADSPNGAWTNKAFRGYADHMGTPEFDAGVDRLLAASEDAPSACMCAEGLWWQCHRRLLADALVVRGHPVVHVFPDGRTDVHTLTPAAVVEGARIVYPPQQATLGI